MDLRPTSNAAAAAKIGNPAGCFLAGTWLRSSSVTGLWPCSFVAPCQPPARKQRAHSLFCYRLLIYKRLRQGVLRAGRILTIEQARL
jgi:hypothetical protein